MIAHISLSSLLVSLLCLPLSTIGDLRPRIPQPRSYDTHAYFSLGLDPASSPQQAAAIAEALRVELVEPIGELAGYWLVRAESSETLVSSRDVVPQFIRRDPVSRRFRSLKATQAHVRSLEPLAVRKRAKRIHTSPPARHIRSLSYGNATRQAESTSDLTELHFAQNELDLKDPILHQQWHLINSQMKEFELNVTGLWARGITGEGVTVAIIDDGLDLHSDDLADNFFPEGSYDFNDHTELPLPRLSDDQHGTRCAGEIAAVPNDVCGVGVSYAAKIAGVRILSAPISDADEAAALNYAYQLNDIYSCSWGPPDDGRSMEAPEGLILKAMVNGVQKGRGGKGSVFVFAAGNGGGSDDQCNFDGYTNSIFSITIGAIDRRGLHPYYSEMCSAMMAVAPSSGSGDQIHTTDVGKDVCAHSHGGTSAAAPLAAGVYALALQARPDLSWRDFQHISVQSAVFFNEQDPDWQMTAAGRNYSYKYGYGRVDAGRFVELAESFVSVKPQTWFDAPAIYLPTTKNPAANASAPAPAPKPADDVWRRQEDVEAEPVPGDNAPSDANDTSPPTATPVTPAEPPPEPDGSFITSDGIKSSFTVTRKMLEDTNFERLEHVTVRVWITHQRRGDVEVELVSPNGISSVLARQRRFDEDGGGFWGWKFMTLKHWDEDPIGEWTLTVKDRFNPEATGKFVAWSLQLWGECVDPALARDWLPAEDGEEDEEQTGSEKKPTPAVSQKPKPTEHLPDDHADAPGEAHEPGLGHPETTSTAAPGNDDTESGGEPTDQEQLEEGWFGGVANLASNTSWMAGAGGVMLVAGASIGGFFVLRQRKKRRNLFGMSGGGEGARGAYAPVSDEVPMGLLERSRRKFGVGGSGGAGARGTKDLYDAFGDGPSDEDDLSDDGDADGGEAGVGLRYHDSFLEDEEAGSPVVRGGRVLDEEKVAEGSAYRDDDDLPPRETREEDKDGEASGASGSSGSWQDAAEEVGR